MQPLEAIEHRGYTINVYPDFDAPNPAEEWDCDPTIIFRPDMSRHEGLTTYGAGDYSLELTREQIRENIDNIKMLFEVDRLVALRSLRYDFFGDSATDAINSLLQEYSEQGATELCEVLALCGYPCDYSSLRDGDAIAVLTPHFFQVTGCRDEFETNKQNLESALHLFTSWAEGSVYGFEVVREDEEEAIDSCWSFYGYDHQKSGLLDAAKSSVDDIIEERAEARIQAAKEEKRQRAREMRDGFALFPNIAEL